MLVHSVYFWLRRDLSDGDRARFRQGLEELKGIESVRAIYVGTPASTDRPAVDRTYDFGLTVILDDMDGHAVYQAHEKHQAFIKQFSSLWIKVVIYDAQ